MKATGIVRRIDDLGRIVIPKEIRKTLKVKVGMPLEIYTDSEGGIILKKYLPFSEFATIAAEYAECIARQTGADIIITDRDKVIAATGSMIKQIVGKPIGEKLERILDDRDDQLSYNERNGFIPAVEGMDPKEQVSALIRSNGELLGAVLIQSGKNQKRIGELEQKAAEIAAEFLGKQINI